MIIDDTFEMEIDNLLLSDVQLRDCTSNIIIVANKKNILYIDN